MGLRSVTHTLMGTPSITLGELRQFLLDVQAAPDDTVLSISSERFNSPTDPGYDRIEVIVR